MQFKQNAAVFSADGHEVGRIDRVVLDPRTKEVTDLIIRQGFLFTEDKVIPINLVASTTTDRVNLDENADNLRNLQPYQDTYYVASNGSLSTEVPIDLPDALYPYPPVVGTTLGAMPIMPTPSDTWNREVVHTATNLPPDTVALKEGARIVSSDDHQVGHVERVFTAADSGKVSHFVISQGLLLKAHKLVPVSWVDSIGENEVRLAVSADLLQTLREYQEA